MTLDCSLAEMAPEMWNVLPDKLNEHIKDFNNCGNRSAAGLNMYANNPNNFYTAINIKEQEMPYAPTQKSNNRCSNIWNLFL